VLLIDDSQPQPPELHLFLDHGVGTHHDLDDTRGDPLQRLALPFHPCGEQGDRDAEALAVGVDVQVVLLGKELGGGHDGHLVIVFDADEGSQKGHQRLAAADVPLHQPVHRVRRDHVLFDLGEHPSLRGGQTEGEQLQKLPGVAVRHLETDAVLKSHPAPLESEPQLKEEQLVKGERAVRLAAPLVELAHHAGEVGRVGLAQRDRKRQESLAPDDIFGKRAGKKPAEKLHHVAHDAAHQFLAHPFGKRIDREDPAEVVGVARHDLGEVLPLRGPLHLGMVHLALRSELRQLADEDAAPAGEPVPFHVGRMEMEPLEHQACRGVAHDHLEVPPPPLGGLRLGREHRGEESFGPAGAQPGDILQFAAVLVAVRQEVEGVLNGGDTLLAQGLGEFGPYSLDEADRGFQLLAGGRRGGFGAGPNSLGSLQLLAIP